MSDSKENFIEILRVKGCDVSNYTVQSGFNFSFCG